MNLRRKVARGTRGVRVLVALLSIVVGLCAGVGTTTRAARAATTTAALQGVAHTPTLMPIPATPITYQQDGVTATVQPLSPPTSPFVLALTVTQATSPIPILSLTLTGVRQPDGTLLWSARDANGEPFGNETTTAAPGNNDCPCGWVELGSAAGSAIVCGISFGAACGAAVGAGVAASEQCLQACSDSGSTDNPPSCTMSATLQGSGESPYSSDNINCEVAPDGQEIEADLWTHLTCNSGCSGSGGDLYQGKCVYGQPTGGSNHNCDLSASYYCATGAGTCTPECVTEFETWRVTYTAYSDTSTHDQYFYGRSNQWCN